MFTAQNQIDSGVVVFWTISNEGLILHKSIFHMALKDGFIAILYIYYFASVFYLGFPP